MAYQLLVDLLPHLLPPAGADLQAMGSPRVDYAAAYDDER